jgi:hypothetical protein
MYTWIGAGGSAFRVLEAILHLCAIGLGPPSLRLLMIDPDEANGNATQAKGLIELYQQCHERLAGRLGGDLNLFGTKLDLFSTDGGVQNLHIWSPVRRQERNLAAMLNYDLLSATETPPEIAHLLFTQAELEMELRQGFRGHTAVGAAAMSLISLEEHSQPWQQVVEKLRGDIAQPGGARVCLVGSIFGGTGASAIHPVVRFLRTIPDTNESGLKIGVTALVPYFRFESSTTTVRADGSNMAAKAERFPLATRAAVEFYKHLRLNGDWDFDAMYWLGDNSPAEVSYAPGGPDQKNPAHFVDLLAALASLEFLLNPTATGGCYYAGPRQDVELSLSTKNLLEWRDLPLRHFDIELVRQQCLRFFLMGSVHLGFFEELLQRTEIDRRPFCVPWYLERFALYGDWLSARPQRETLELVSSYFRTYHFPWWASMHRQDTVRLFNREAIPGRSGASEVDLSHLANSLWPNASEHRNRDQFDKFFDDMMRVSKRREGDNGAPAYLALLAHTADRYIDREYKKTGAVRD